MDREILKEAARALGLAEVDLEPREERAASVWDRVLGSFAQAVPEAGYVPPTLPPLYEDDLFRTESRIIREVAARSDAVIVGRAGFHVLAGHPGLVSVALRADREWRVRRVAEIYGLDRAVAAERVDVSDRRRTDFIKTYTGRDWDDASVHDLCLDTSRLGLELATELVTTTVRDRMERLAHPHPTPAT
jgi:cytidylate kinase